MAKNRQPRLHSWLDLARRSGLLVTEPVLCEVFPTGPEKTNQYIYRRTLNERQRWLADPGAASRFANWKNFILHDLLELPQQNIRRKQDFTPELSIYLIDYDQSISPNSVLFNNEDNPVLGIWTTAHEQDLDRVEKTRGKWRTTPNAKAVRWMRETGVSFVLLTNGSIFRILHTPPGLPEVSIDFNSSDWEEEKQFVDAFSTLLKQERKKAYLMLLHEYDMIMDNTISNSTED